MVRMVRMVRSLADRTFQLWLARVKRSPGSGESRNEGSSSKKTERIVGRCTIAPRQQGEDDAPPWSHHVCLPLQRILRYKIPPRTVPNPGPYQIRTKSENLDEFTGICRSSPRFCILKTSKSDFEDPLNMEDHFLPAVEKSPIF